MAPTLQTQRGVAPDGRRVTISCMAETLQDDWHWHARMTSKTLAIGVSVASPSYAELSISQHDYQVTQTLNYLGRPLQVAVAPDGEGYLVAWNGLHHSIVFGGAGSAPSLGDMIQLLDQFSIQDSGDGLVMLPQPGSGIVMWNIVGAKFSDAGLITIYPREEAEGLIPDQPGLQTSGGNLWKKTLSKASGEPAPGKYLHVGATSVTLLDDDLGRDPDVTAAGQEALLGSLAVRWEG